MRSRALPSRARGAPRGDGLRADRRASCTSTSRRCSRRSSAQSLPLTQPDDAPRHARGRVRDLTGQARCAMSERTPYRAHPLWRADALARARSSCASRRRCSGCSGFRSCWRSRSGSRSASSGAPKSTVGVERGAGAPSASSARCARRRRSRLSCRCAARLRERGAARRAHRGAGRADPPGAPVATAYDDARPRRRLGAARGRRRAAARRRPDATALDGRERHVRARRDRATSTSSCPGCSA